MSRCKQIVVKVFAPGNRSFKTYRLNAKPGRVVTEQGIDTALARVADLIEKEYPLDEYELKELAHHQFNFIWKGFRQPSKEGIEP